MLVCSLFLVWKFHWELSGMLYFMSNMILFLSIWRSVCIYIWNFMCFFIFYPIKERWLSFFACLVLVCLKKTLLPNQAKDAWRNQNNRKKRGFDDVHFRIEQGWVLPSSWDVASGSLYTSTISTICFMQ